MGLRAFRPFPPNCEHVLADDLERSADGATRWWCGDGAADLDRGADGQGAGAVAEQSPPLGVDAEQHPVTVAFDDAPQGPYTTDEIAGAIAVER